MVGVDIVSIERVEKFITKFGDRALERFLSQDEIVLTNRKIETIAGFWASKEAISKALKSGIGSECSFFDIEIRKSKKNAPSFKISNRLNEKFKIKDSSLSISHDGGFAIAVAIVLFK